MKSINCFLILVCASICGAKPLNQNQVRFRRVPPKEFSAALGSSITIECEAGASPPPTIHWLKDGKRILQNELDLQDDNQLGDGTPVDDINRIALSSTRARLFIDCADFQDEAVYTCVAQNAFTRVSTHTRLSLIKPTLDAAAAAASADSPAPGSGAALSALPQCLSQRTGNTEPARIHMWTQNIVEIMKNDVLLLCRSNLKPTQKLAVTWTLPDEKLVTEEQRDKFEILDTGDLLIKDLRWTDMGTYICTVTDDQTTDSVSSFVYPASRKANTKRIPNALQNLARTQQITVAIETPMGRRARVR